MYSLDVTQAKILSGWRVVVSDGVTRCSVAQTEYLLVWRGKGPGPLVHDGWILTVLKDFLLKTHVQNTQTFYDEQIYE